ncbi:hypothetical protein D3C80_1728300 [compost metagenome]
MPYSSGITKGATSIRNSAPSRVQVVLIRKALKVSEIASSFESSEAFGNSTTVMEFEKKLTIRDRLTATAYSPRSAGRSRPAIMIWSMYVENWPSRSLP